jgi:formate dehydrogenase iron-sulfur subunit
MSVKIYIPGDSGAVAVGADKVAREMADLITVRGIDAEIIRNGSRGLYWLEPMIEVETGSGRKAYGPVKPSDLESLLDAGLLNGGDHPLGLGPTDEIAFLKRQTRLTFARCGLIDPLSLEAYRQHGGLAGLTNAVACRPKPLSRR